MREYRCRACNCLLFRSDAIVGRLETVCPDRRCKTIQTVFLGGHFKDRRMELVRAAEAG